MHIITSRIPPGSSPEGRAIRGSVLNSPGHLLGADPTLPGQVCKGAAQVALVQMPQTRTVRSPSVLPPFASAGSAISPAEKLS